MFLGLEKKDNVMCDLPMTNPTKKLRLYTLVRPIGTGILSFDSWRNPGILGTIAITQATTVRQLTPYLYQYVDRDEATYKSGTWNTRFWIMK